MLPLLKLFGFSIMLLGNLVCASESGKRQELVVYQMHKNKKLASPDASNPVTDFKIQTLEYDEKDEKRIEKCLIMCSDNRFGGDMSVDRMRCNAVQFWTEGGTMFCEHYQYCLKNFNDSLVKESPFVETDDTKHLFIPKQSGIFDKFVTSKGNGNFVVLDKKFEFQVFWNTDSGLAPDWTIETIVYIEPYDIAAQLCLQSCTNSHALNPEPLDVELRCTSLSMEILGGKLHCKHYHFFFTKDLLQKGWFRNTKVNTDLYVMTKGLKECGHNDVKHVNKEYLWWGNGKFHPDFYFDRVTFDTIKDCRKMAMGCAKTRGCLGWVFGADGKFRTPYGDSGLTPVLQKVDIEAGIRYAEFWNCENLTFV